MWIIVEILVVGALIATPWLITKWERRERKPDTRVAVAVCSFLSLIFWFLLNELGLMIGPDAPSTVSSVQRVVSIKFAPQGPSVFVRTWDGDQVQSFKTQNLKLQESEEEERLVAEIKWRASGYPTWWPRVVSLLVAEPYGRPTISIRARKEKLEEILAKL